MEEKDKNKGLILMPYHCVRGQLGLMIFIFYPIYIVYRAQVAACLAYCGLVLLLCLGDKYFSDSKIMGQIKKLEKILEAQSLSWYEALIFMLFLVVLFMRQSIEVVIWIEVLKNGMIEAALIAIKVYKYRKGVVNR